METIRAIGDGFYAPVVSSLVFYEKSTMIYL